MKGFSKFPSSTINIAYYFVDLVIYYLLEELITSLFNYLAIKLLLLLLLF